MRRIKQVTISSYSDILMTNEIRKLYPKGYLESSKIRTRIISDNTKLAIELTRWKSSHLIRLLEAGPPPPSIEKNDYLEMFICYLKAKKMMPPKKLLDDLKPSIADEIQRRTLNVK